MPVDQYIATLRATFSAPATPATEAACVRVAQTMGLVHTLQDFELLREDPPELRSPQSLGACRSIPTTHYISGSAS